jgi:hypothetical protein
VQEGKAASHGVLWLEMCACTRACIFACACLCGDLLRTCTTFAERRAKEDKAALHDILQHKQTSFLSKRAKQHRLLDADRCALQCICAFLSSYARTHVHLSVSACIIYVRTHAYTWARACRMYVSIVSARVGILTLLHVYVFAC